MICYIFHRYTNRASRCNLKTSIVSITCIHDSFALCDENELPWKGSCYSLNFNRSTFDEASNACINQGKKLVEINDQDENDLISELLLQSQYSKGLLSQVWTGGKARSNRRRSASYYWDASNSLIGSK